MRIYKMTATFGKLEHDTLTLKPGLNIIHAPNEWGKSTWCAFLMAMLYGLDTRAKSTKTVLADKERYAPWSGSPMSGRIDLRWNDRDITIERKTKGRIPLGDFRAYETATGIEVKELTAANCAEALLGVEQSVFRRAGFIRLSDLPVTADEALRRRLNALVTTGDESGDGERLARDLKELKNRCRYNRTGLLPQAEAERDELEKKARELDAMEVQSKKLKLRLGEVKSWIRELENHEAALAYAASEADAGRVAEALDAYDKAEQRLAELENSCSRLPSREAAEGKIQSLRIFQEQWSAAQMEAQLLPDGPQPPIAPEPFREMDVDHAMEMVGEDTKYYQSLKASKAVLPFFVIGLVCLIGMAALMVLSEYLFAGVLGLAGVLMLILAIRKRSALKKQCTALEEKYGSPDPNMWREMLEAYVREQKAFALAQVEYHTTRGDLDGRLAALQKQRQSLCGDQTPERVLEIWQQVVARWEEYHIARRDAQRAGNYLETLQAMVKPAKRPAMEDNLTYSTFETARLLSDAGVEQQRLLGRLGQYRGRMEALGEAEALQKQLEQVNHRIRKLEDMYAAATIGLETLTQARLELQRRFAPRITKRAQELLHSLTLGRYDRLTLGEDFSLNAGAGEEDTLHDCLWRSDGTVDQLYLALRLAVAEELTPDAPLILDDAFVRFDDERMKAALIILKEMAKTKQVILFSCQDREKNMVSM